MKSLAITCWTDQAESTRRRSRQILPRSSVTRPKVQFPESCGLPCVGIGARRSREAGPGGHRAARHRRENQAADGAHS